ncbi:MAG: glycosyltransferase family 2 protein [Symploca sp. SIO2D2]|nr:glycosyltransferase family 2 protein [Symploca sp. SIO2D2]
MISVIIPALNEENSIVLTVKEVLRVLASLDMMDAEVIIIDDGSSDSTGKLATEAGAKVIRHPHNMGYGFSLKTGIKAARFDTIVITDADGTYPIEAIPKLLEEYEKGFNLVVGSRTGRYYRESLLKMPLRIVLRWLVEFVVGHSVPDINSGLRVFSKQDILPYFNHLCDSFSFTTSMTLAYSMTKKFLTYIPITYHKRIGKTKVRLLRDSLRTLQYIVQAALYYNPLKIFIVLCFLVLFCSVIFFMISIIFNFLSAFILGIGCILLTIIIFALGLIADLLRQIMVK